MVPAAWYELLLERKSRDRPWLTIDERALWIFAHGYGFVGPVKDLDWEHLTDDAYDVGHDDIVELFCVCCWCRVVGRLVGLLAAKSVEEAV